jgi:hypothetical protein
LTTTYDFWLTSQFTYKNASGTTVIGYQIFPLDLGNPPTCTTLTTFTIPLGMLSLSVVLRYALCLFLMCYFSLIYILSFTSFLFVLLLFFCFLQLLIVRLVAVLDGPRGALHQREAAEYGMPGPEGDGDADVSRLQQLHADRLLLVRFKYCILFHLFIYFTWLLLLLLLLLLLFFIVIYSLMA